MPLHSALIPWLSPETLITGAGPWALLVVCAIIFAETGLLIGFIFPGDTLLLITGLLVFKHTINIDIWWVALTIGFAAFLGGESGYFIGRKAGPRIFERKETGLISMSMVRRTNGFFAKYGGTAVILARFVPVVRTFAPVAAGLLATVLIAAGVLPALGRVATSWEAVRDLLAWPGFWASTALTLRIGVLATALSLALTLTLTPLVAKNRLAAPDRKSVV